MNRLKNRIASYSITPLGAVVLVAIVIAFAASAVGPASLQRVAFIVGTCFLLLLLGDSVSVGRYGGSNKSLQRRREEFGPRSRNAQDDAAGSTPGDAEAWRRERERREQRN